MIVPIVLLAAYTTMLIHGLWHANQLDAAIERGLGRKLKKPENWYLHLVFIPVLAPAISYWILFSDGPEWAAESAVDTIDEDGGCTEEEWARVEAELKTYMESLR